jgi:hypothetical protein
MKRPLSALMLAIFSASLSVSQVPLAQTPATTGPIQVGFVVVTPQNGGGQGLSVSETFGQRVNGNFFQSSVLPSPLVTLTNVVVNVDLNTGTDTGVAILNPNDATATISLALSNDRGNTISARTINFAGRTQLARFVTELFPGLAEFSQPFTGLLFINSDVPISVMGLAFVGPSFTSLPVATQLNSNGTVVFTGVSTPTATTPIVPGITVPITTPTVPITTPGVTGITTAIPSPVTGLVVSQPVTAVSTPLVNATGALTPATIGQITTTPITMGQITTSVTTGTISVSGSPPIANAFPVIAQTAILLPQLATGGGWVTQITIANTSTVPQTVRVDFFNSAGGPLVLPIGSSLPSVLVPAGGVVTFSTI